MRTVCVGVAGFLGTVSRYWFSGLLSQSLPGAYPWATWLVNVSGCFMAGLLSTLIGERLLPNPALRTAATVGFLGAFTTFSAFAYSTVRLWQAGAAGLALLNVISSILAGLAAAWLGIVIGHTL